MILSSFVMSAAVFIMQNIASVPIPEFVSSDSFYSDAKTCEDYSDGVKVSFKKTSNNVDIYYRINGVTSGFHEYTGSFVLFENATVEAYAESDSGVSYVEQRDFHIRRQVSATHISGIYDEAFNLKFLHANCDCVQESKTLIYYTMDGTTPTEESERYDPDKGIDISDSCCLTIIVVPDNNSETTIQHYDYIIADESILSDYKSKYYYNTLSDEQKKAYDLVYKAAVKGNTKLDVSELNMKLDDFWVVMEACMNENPQFFIDCYKVRYASFAKKVTFLGNENFKEQKEQTETALLDLYHLILQKNASTDYEVVKAIHDVLVDVLTYDKEADDRYNAAGAFLDRHAVCQGYAMAFMYLCQQMGVDCIVVSGFTPNALHSWNMVKLNGEWKHVDVCWDDSKKYDYEYFLKDYEQINNTHTLDMVLDIP